MLVDVDSTGLCALESQASMLRAPAKTPCRPPCVQVRRKTSSWSSSRAMKTMWVWPLTSLALMWLLSSTSTSDLVRIDQIRDVQHPWFHLCYRSAACAGGARPRSFSGDLGTRKSIGAEG